MMEARDVKQAGDMAGEIEVEAFRRLFPLPYYERFLPQGVRPDARPLHCARDTSIALGPVSTADGSALVKIGETTMLAAIKLEVVTPSADSPDEGCLSVDFHMPPICSPTVRPGRPAEISPVVSKQLIDVIMSSGMIKLKELSLISGKAAWMAYMDIYCLNADGSLYDSALLSAVAALSHLQIPPVSLDGGGKVVVAVAGDLMEGKPKIEVVNKEKRNLSIGIIPFSMTCILHDKYILVDPTMEEESVMDTLVTVVVDPLGRLVSVYKAGGAVAAYTSTMKEFIKLARGRATELQSTLQESLSADMDLEN